MASYFRNKNTFLLVLIFIGTVFLSSGFVHAQTLSSSISEGSLDSHAAENQISPSKDSNSFVVLLMTPLNWIFQVAGWFLGVAGVMFIWVVDPQNIKGIVGSQAVYQVWQTVRDFLNMFFILVLLFSAFATIFQIDKYNIKKIWLNVVLMALLVNFSFPITRFIIDVSNVIMYHLLNGLFPGGDAGIASQFLAFSDITKILMPEKMNGDAAKYLLVAIVFVFMMAVSLMVIGILLLIRLVVLAILVMLSPIGFIGNIFPAFGKYSSDWWDSLFKYAFMGPIMIFFVGVSLMMMQAVKEFNMINGSTNNTANGSEASWIASLAFSIVPIVMLWTGIGAAQKTGIAGAGTVSGWGKKIAKEWGGVRTATRFMGVNAGVTAAKEDFFKKGNFLGHKIPLYGGSEATDRRGAQWAGALTNKNRKSGWDDAQIEHERKKVNELRKEWKDAGGASDTDLKDALHGNDRVKARAAALEMAEKNGFGDTDADRLLNYKKAVEAIGNDKIANNIFDDKVKEKHIKIVIDNEGGTDDAYKKHLGKMTAEQLAKQKNFHSDVTAQDYMERNIQDRNFLTETAKKMSQADREKWATSGKANLRGSV